MAEWEMNSNLDSSTINNGRRYDDNDGITPEAINAVYETVFYINHLAKNISAKATTLPSTMNATAWCNITAGGFLEFGFSIPQGKQGEQGIQGVKGETGDKGAIFTLNGNVLTITSNTN